MTDHCGYANFETWNVALWLRDWRVIARGYKDKGYPALADHLAGMGIRKTPDNVLYNDPKLDTGALSDFLRDL